MLVGISLPFYAVHSSAARWEHSDTLATMVCLIGLFCAYVADNELRAFMVMNARRRAKGQKPVLLLDTGEGDRACRSGIDLHSICIIQVRCIMLHLKSAHIPAAAVNDC